MALHTLLYTSAATHEMDKKGLRAILGPSRKHNLRHGITGLLLYYPRSFMQVLEGERDAVLELYERIVRDDRHTAIDLIVDEPLDERVFPDWTMGLRLLDETDVSCVEGFSDFFKEGFKESAVDARRSLAKSFLLVFRDGAKLKQ